VLASGDLREKTAVFFRVFKDGYGKPKVLMCTDPTKYGQLSPTFPLPTK
jgi:beta-fructofuranosidase